MNDTTLWLFGCLATFTAAAVATLAIRARSGRGARPTARIPAPVRSLRSTSGRRRDHAA